jgi:peptidoglycan hydrolase CwlO-like protein
MNKHKRLIVAVAVVLGFGAMCWLSSSNAAEISTKEYEISVPAMKTDMQRMVEAYERLSDQYLSLVQNQLNNMSANNRDVLTRLDRIERKLDELSGKVAALQAAMVTAAPAPAAPAESSDKSAGKESSAKP